MVEQEVMVVGVALSAMVQLEEATRGTARCQTLPENREVVPGPKMQTDEEVYNF